MSSDDTGQDVGFNLYYGALKGTQYRWLDLQGLFDDLLPDYDVVWIRYFTARIKQAANPTDPQAPDRQKAYLNALRSLARVQVIEGNCCAQSVVLQARTVVTRK